MRSEKDNLTKKYITAAKPKAEVTRAYKKARAYVTKRAEVRKFREGLEALPSIRRDRQRKKKTNWDK